MIEISVWKILLVLAVALVVLGPDHLPKVARNMGRLLVQLRNALGAVQEEMKSISADIQKEPPTQPEQETQNK